MSKFDRENFILDYFSVDWEDLLKIDELNAENSTKMYLDQCPGTQIHFSKYSRNSKNNFPIIVPKHKKPHFLTSMEI